MNLLDVIRVVIDDSIGTRGALDNCRRELARPFEDDRTVGHLRARVAALDTQIQPTTAEHHRPAS